MIGIDALIILENTHRIGHETEGEHTKQDYPKQINVNGTEERAKKRKNKHDIAGCYEQSTQAA